jgi:K+-sensing histidine kinase KdpD
MGRDRSPDQVAAAAAAAFLAPLVAAALMVAVRDEVAKTNMALALVAVVVAAGALGGRLAGAVAAVSATVSFNFFLTSPYLSLRLTSANDVETMMLLLLIGGIAGEVAAVGQRRARAARSGNEEEEGIWRVVEQAVSDADPEDLIEAVRAELLALLKLHQCWWDPRRDHSTLPVLQPRGIFEAPRDDRFVDGHFELPSDGFDIPVRAFGTILGYFRCVPTVGVGVGLERRRVAVVLADILGLALRGPTPLLVVRPRRHSEPEAPLP